ncbi:hypothetical protein AgCh_000787 [Apium graveolens]
MEAIRRDWGWGGFPGWLLRDREEAIAAAEVYPRMPSYYFMDSLFMELAKKVDYSRPYSAKTMHFFLTWASCGVGPPINQVDSIFVPANVNQNHWILMVFFVKEWGVMVLDPMNYNAKYPEEEEEECVVRMTMFLEATDPKYLDRIKEGPHKPTKLVVAVAGKAAKSIPKEKSDYTDKDIASIAKDAKVRYLLHSAIDNVMSNRVINCKTAKEIWDALEQDVRELIRLRRTGRQYSLKSMNTLTQRLMSH